MTMDNVESGTKVLEQVDAGRRAAVRRFIGVAFAAPVVASFSLSGLGVNEAHAYASNCGPLGCGGGQTPGPITTR
jgi:hypothetical protein